MDPLAPVTYGNLLFKLHPFLSKLCQTRNFPYIILYYIIYTYAHSHTHTHTHTHTCFTVSVIRLPLLQSMYSLPATKLLYPPPSTYPPPPSLSTLQCKTWTHTKSSSTALITIYILCRFVFNATKHPGGLIGQKETTKSFCSAVARSSVSQPFS